MGTIASLLVKLGVDADDVDKGMSKAAGFIDKHGEGLQRAAAGIGIAAGAALGAGLAQALDGEAAIKKLQAQIGPGSQAAGDLGKVAGDLYAKGFGEQMGDVAAAVRGVWTDGLVDEDAATADIEAIGAKAINTAHLMEEEYGAVTRAVGQMIKTGLVKNASEGFDLLVRGTQQGVNKSQDLLDTFNEYGTQFRKLGLDGPAALGLLSQAIQAGARDSDVAADALKEFSIRAVDGSTASAAGFKALGLDAEAMTAKIARGGPEAAAGLQQVLTAIRAIKDPAAQSQAAVALFGTQAEDLGAALLAMDPSTAVASLGEVAGAADRAGATLNDTASSKLETFKRQMMSTFVDVAGGKVVPVLSTTADWIGRNKSLVMGFAAVLGVFAVAVGTVKAGLMAYNGVMMIIRAATVAWTGVQWALNIAMSLNPLGLIIIAVIAVVAIIVLLWMKCEGFRKIVLGLWSALLTAFKAIGAAAVWLWQKGIKPAIDAIVVAALWLWHNAIEPVVNGIVTGFKWLIGMIAAGAAFWFNIFRSIGALVFWLWLQAVKPVVDFILFGVAMVGAGFTWLYNNAIKPSIDGIALAAMWLWTNAIKPAWDFILWGIGLVAAGFTWLWVNAIKPALDALGAGAMWVWDKMIKPAFDAIVGGATWLGNTFQKIFSAIGGFVSSAFGTAVSTVKSSINGVIGMLNNALGFINSKVIATANKVPGVSFPSIPTIPFLAKGGTALTGGTAVVGDNGPELLDMPRGARVTPLPRGGGGGGSVRVYLDTTGADGEMTKLMRKIVRVEGAGDVQLALGKG